MAAREKGSETEVDCEKLDELAIDLVYDELDPARAAQAEQHLVGCARCSALIDRLRAGKRGAEALTLETPPQLLEARILEAAAQARRPVALPRRVARAISTAGAYAMRPQVAMAAVLVVMVGMSALMLHDRSGGGVHQTKVTDEGTPVASVAPESAGAPAVIGGGESAASRAREEPAPAGSVAQPAADGKPADEAEKHAAGPRKGGDDLPGATANAEDKQPAGGDVLDYLAKEKKGEADEAHATPPPAPKDSPVAKTAKPATAAAAAPTSAPAATATATAMAIGSASVGAGSPAGFDDAMKAYGEKRFAASAAGFDASFAAGARPSTSLLFAARSYRAQGSIPKAMARFQRTVSDYGASAEAPYAAVEGGECARDAGDIATARALLEKARGYPSTKARAEADLAALNAPPAKPLAPTAPMSDTKSDY